MYTNMLIATDGSELAGNAVQHGIALAMRIVAKVTVLTVSAPFHVFTTDLEMVLEDTAAQYQAGMQQRAEKILGAIAPWRKQRASHARRFMSNMSIRTKRLSTRRRREAVILLSWPHTAVAASLPSSSAARRSRYSHIPRSRYSSITELWWGASERHPIV